MNRLLPTALLASVFINPVQAMDYFNFDNKVIETEKPKDLLDLGNEPNIFYDEKAELHYSLKLPEIHEPIDSRKVKRSISERKKIEPAIAACLAAKPVTIKGDEKDAGNNCTSVLFTSYNPVWNPETSNCEWVENTSREAKDCEAEFIPN